MDFSPIKEEDNYNFLAIPSSDGHIKNENVETDISDSNLITMLDIKTESPDPLMIEDDTINMEPKIFEPHFHCEIVFNDTVEEVNVRNAKETDTQLEPSNASSTLKRKYSCSNCPMNFTSKKFLQKHNKVHEEKCETYQCDICGRLFQHKSNLFCHKKIHMTADGSIPRGKREFTNDERNVILQFLSDRKIEGHLPKGSLAEAAKKFECNRSTISSIWKRAREGFANGNTCPSVDSLKKQCGRKRTDYSDKLAELRKITQNESVSLKSLSRTLSIPKTTLYNIYRRGEIIRESSQSKPNLSEENRRERSKFCLSKLLPNGNFEEFYDYVHVDEKSYYLTKLNQSYYLSLDEAGPQISSERNFVTKVVIIAAVARPRYHDANNLFDGKIGIWTFVSQELVQRERSIRSERKMKGKMKKKHIESVNRDDIRKSVVRNLYHAIYEKWPNKSKTMPIYVQLDESKSHLSPFDANVVEEGLKHGWNISLKPQPPNSSDFNAVDKGFFNTLQSLESKTYWKAVEDLVSEIESTYNNESRSVLENAFLCLRKAMECSSKDNGSNNFNFEEMEVTFDQTPSFDVHMQIDTTVNTNKAKVKREFTNEERNAIFQFLLVRQVNGKLPQGSLAAAAKKFECNRETVSRIWKRASEGIANGDTCPRVDSLKKQCGRKRIDYSDKLSKIPQNVSVSLKTLSRSLSIPRTTLYNIYRRGDLKRESDDVQPTVTAENTRERFAFCTSKLLQNGLLEELYDYVHVDEKCYYLTKLNKSYFLSLDGKGPQILSERNFVTKVVIVAAVARPRYDDSKNNLFDGKIGIWSFVSQELVKRNRSIRSERKMKGKLKNKSIESMNKDDIRKSVLQKLYHAIRQKWPSQSKTMPIYVQLDESKPHLSTFNANIAEQDLRNGCNIQLTPQPVNSPDFNALPQGFFNSMQSIESKKYWKSVDELVTEIETAFNVESPDSIVNAFSSVRTSMEKSLAVDRSNDYNWQEMDMEQIYPNYEIL